MKYAEGFSIHKYEGFSIVKVSNAYPESQETFTYILHKKGVIIFHGYQSNIKQHLHENDVFVLPSYYREGLPRTNLEACACGNPIITTDSVGCRESVVEGVNGFLIEPQNLDDLIKAMEYFIKNPYKIKEMGFNSRKYAEQRFDVNIINNDLLKLINKVLKI